MVTDEDVLAKLQESELNLLLELSNYLDANSYTWFLEAGTVLGAVRHGGFIPWDDDIDIAMPRTDYNRFINEASDSLPSSMRLDIPGKTIGMASLFSKVCWKGTSFETEETLSAGYDQGIFIDVFPFDNLVSNEKGLKRQIAKAQFWKTVSYLYHSPMVSKTFDGIKGRAYKQVFKIAHSFFNFAFSEQLILDKFNEACSMSDESDVNLGCLCAPSVVSYARSVLIPVDFASFCGHILPVPGMTVDYLEKKYGNWRSIPAEKDRHTHLPLRIVFQDGEEWVSAHC